MVRSQSDDNKETEPPRLSPKVWTVGSIPVTDEGFLKWCGYQTKKGAPLAMMTLYVQQQLNLEAKMLHEQQRKERRELSHPSETAGAVLLSEPNEQSTASATEGTSMNSPTPNPQNIPFPVSQNIPFPVSQNISFPVSQNISSPVSRNISNPVPQNIQAAGWIPTSLNLEPPPQISSPQPALTLSPPTATRTEQEQGSRSAVQKPGAVRIVAI
jgi:hypothetical protein